MTVDRPGGGAGVLIVAVAASAASAACGGCAAGGRATEVADVEEVAVDGGGASPSTRVGPAVGSSAVGSSAVGSSVVGPAVRSSAVGSSAVGSSARAASPPARRAAVPGPRTGSPVGERSAVAEGDAASCVWDPVPGSASSAGSGFVQGVERIELDGVPPVDAIVDLGICSAWGDCRLVVLQACGGGRFRAVWGPEHAQSIALGPRVAGAALPDLVVQARSIEGTCEVNLRVVEAWTPEGWSRGEPCAVDDGPWDVAACGARPPACREVAARR